MSAHPQNRPTPLAALGTAGPTPGHFRRDHHAEPRVDAATAVCVDGLVERPAAIDRAALERLPATSLAAVLECAGHRRAELVPRTPGLQWEVGAVGEAVWTGAPLALVLEAAGVRDGAAEVVLTGADSGPFEGLAGAHPYARSLPLAKALHRDTLIAYAMNGRPIPPAHGGPLRAIVPGWYATDSVKWLAQVTVVDAEFDGPFQAREYRYAEAGDDGPGARMTEVPVHALITTPAAGATVRPGEVVIQGAAWGGVGGVVRVEVRVDDGPWLAASLTAPASRYGRRLWTVRARVPADGAALSVRATDAAGNAQPDMPRWNRGGYANNAVHTIVVGAAEPAPAPRAGTAAARPPA